MSFKDYVRHMTQKYRLAVAIAFLKNKPENTAIEQYIQQLQDKIKENDIEDDVICSDDFNIDDADFNSGDNYFNVDGNDVLMTNEIHQSFNVDEIEIDTQYYGEDTNSINILENFEAVVNTIDVNNIEIDENDNINMTQNAANTIRVGHDRNKQLNISITIGKDFDEDKNSNKENNSKKAKIDDTVTVNNAEMTSIDQNMAQTESYSIISVLRTLRGIEDNIEVENDSLFDNGSQVTYFESSQVDAMDTRMNIDTPDINITFSAHENYDIHNLNTGIGIKGKADNSLNNRIIENVTKNLNKNNAKVSSSIDDNLHKTVHEDNNNNVEANKDVMYKNGQELKNNILRNDSQNFSEYSLQNDFFKDKVEIVAKNIDKAHRSDLPNIERTLRDEVEQRLFKELDQTTHLTVDNKLGDAKQDSQETIIYTLQGFTQNTAHISQSQCQNINIPDRYIFGNKSKETTSKESSVVNFQDGNNITELVNKEIAVTNPNVKELTNKDIKIQNPEITKVDSSKIQYIIDKNGKTYAVLQEIQINNNTSTTEFNNTNVRHKTNTHEEKETNLEPSVERTQIENSRTNTEHEGTDEENALTTAESQMEDVDIDVSTSQQEIVPFKVVKELSKLKAYLNRRDRVNVDGFSLDSGYRSDSQHSSYKNAHLSDNWMHQSAYCLYNYVVQCPLVAGTQDIISEISLVLGKLIDRLHEEEKYPSFIEDLLGTVDTLLDELYHGGGGCENILLEKDETIQRLFLLNISSHILKYSIEKLTVMIENIHTYLTSEETLYELTNIQEIENITYIFYVLEILLQKYLKSKNDIQSQSQSSQEVKVLKKSSIADIWRRKWNSKFKENSIEGSQRTCVLVRCGDVLNKIIVECIEGYSLVSFAALQCFNLLQG